jgi:hypothetical protein
VHPDSRLGRLPTTSAVSDELAHYWHHPGLPDVGLLRARFVTHRFGRHAHEGYTVGLIESGGEEFHHKRTLLRAGPGAIAILNPEVVHTGHAGVPEGAGGDQPPCTADPERARQPQAVQRVTPAQQDVVIDETTAVATAQPDRESARAVSRSPPSPSTPCGT